MKRIFLILVLLAAAAFIASAKVELAPIFADSMVLQQQTDAALWGKAEPGKKVVITTTWSEATVYNCSGIPVSPFRTDDWK